MEFLFNFKKKRVRTMPLDGRSTVQCLMDLVIVFNFYYSRQVISRIGETDISFNGTFD
jgi:hypothetical protein